MRRSFHRGIVCLLFAFVLFPLLLAQNITKPNIIGPEGVEINSYTGNLYYERVDYSLPGKGLDLAMVFYYNSAQKNEDVGYGLGWTFEYGIRYAVEADTFSLTWNNGREDDFILDNSTYSAPVGVFDTLSQYQPGKYCLRKTDGMRYYFDDSTHKQLTRITDPNGNSIDLTYQLGLLNKATESGGRELEFDWSSGHLRKIIDQNSASPREFTYDYIGDSLLIRVTNPLGEVNAYQYGQNAELVSIIDPKESPVDVIYNLNFSVKRVISCYTDHRITYNISNRKTYVTERTPQGNVMTTYHYDGAGRVAQKEGNCCGSNQTFTYDSDNNISQRTDANGNTFLYVYDDRGNRLSETDPLGNSASYTYDPVFNRMLSVTDKNGHTSTYQYDTDGNLSQINHPNGITETYTYTADGLRSTYTNGRGKITQYQYDAAGNLIGIIQPDTVTLSMVYDVYGNLLVEVNGKGDSTRYVYDVLNRPVTTIDPLGFETHFTYDVKGNRTQVTDPKGNTTHFEYDPFDRLVEIRAPQGTTTTYSYDPRGNLLQESDPNGGTTSHTYDDRNRRLSSTDALGNQTYYEYDGNGNLTAITDPRGNTTYLEYDALDHRVKQVDPEGGKTIMDYDPVGNLLSQTDPNGNATRYIYDALNRQIKVINALGQTTDITYDGNNNQKTTTNPKGHLTTLYYDSMDRVTSVVNNAGDSTAYRYDDNGNQILVIDELGLMTAYVYDARNQLISETNPEGETLTYSYDGNGNRLSIGYPSGNTVVYSFDSLNRVRSVSDDLGQLIAYGYDANGNQLYEVSANGDSSQYVYDAMNRRIAMRDGLGQSMVYTYDANGNAVESTNRKGQTTRYSFDKNNRMLVMTNPLQHTTTNSYDAAGNLISIIDAKGNATLYSYDALNRRTSTQLADGSAQTVAYDVNGNKITDINGAGQSTNYQYDNLDRLIGRIYSTGNNDSYSYDAAGRMLTATNADATIVYTYDDASRMLSESLNGKTTSYTYDVVNGVRTLTYPGGRSITEQIDDRGRVETIQEGGNALASFLYDAGDRLSQRTFQNGITTTWTYDANSQITDLTHGSSALLQYHYEYDAEGNRTLAEKLHRPTHSEAYVYDASDRLLGFLVGTAIGNTVAAPIQNQNFNYDPVGNRVSASLYVGNITYAANPVNQYVSISGAPSVAATPAYDGSGNLTFDGSHQYAYDAENRLTAVDNGATARYRYDARGRRIQKEIGATVINYFYNGARVIEEQDGTGATLATYVYGIWVDDVLSMDRGGSRYFYHSNALGSVAAITDAAGMVVERYRYDAYGSPEIMDAAFIPLATSSISNPYLFTGRRWDVETGNYYYRARYYNPVSGRFLQRDPLGYVDGMNLYEYVKSNPHTKIDPFGLFVNSGYDYLIQQAKQQIDGITNGILNLVTSTKNAIINGIIATLRFTSGSSFSVTKRIKKKFFKYFGFTLAYGYRGSIENDCVNGELTAFGQLEGKTPYIFFGVGALGLRGNVGIRGGFQYCFCDGDFEFTGKASISITPFARAGGKIDFLGKTLFEAFIEIGGGGVNEFDFQTGQWSGWEGNAYLRLVYEYATGFGWWDRTKRKEIRYVFWGNDSVIDN